MPNYATVDQVRAWKVAGSVVDTTAYTDDEISERLDLAEFVIESYTGTVFYEFDRTIYLDGQDDLSLFTYPQMNAPLLSFTSVKEVNVSLEETRQFEYPIEFSIHPWQISRTWAGRMSSRFSSGCNGGWPIGRRNIEIVGHWGRTVVPVGVKTAAIYVTLENLIPGSSGLVKSDVYSQKWDDYEIQYKGNKETAPGATTGLDSIDRLLQPFILNPSLFLSTYSKVPN